MAMRTPSFESARDALLGWARENQARFGLSDDSLVELAGLTGAGNMPGCRAFNVQTERGYVFASLCTAAVTHSAVGPVFDWARQCKGQSERSFLAGPKAKPESCAPVCIGVDGYGVKHFVPANFEIAV